MILSEDKKTKKKKNKEKKKNDILTNQHLHTDTGLVSSRLPHIFLKASVGLIFWGLLGRKTPTIGADTTLATGNLAAPLPSFSITFFFPPAAEPRHGCEQCGYGLVGRFFFSSEPSR